LVAGVVAALFLQLVQPLLVVERWFQLASMAALGGLLHYSLLALAGVLKWDDLRFAWSALNPRDMGRYLRDELKR
jgi:protein-S-isoprenylcysteine O-methyltransferase Ste14